MPDQTTAQRLADHLLGGTLDEFVTTRRDRGTSWRQIAHDLRADTGLSVTHETLRVWYSDTEAA